MIRKAFVTDPEAGRLARRCRQTWSSREVRGQVTVGISPGCLRGHLPAPQVPSHGVLVMCESLGPNHPFL